MEIGSGGVRKKYAKSVGIDASAEAEERFPPNKRDLSKGTPNAI